MADARRIHRRLQGGWHDVYTAVALIRVEGGKPRGRRVFVERTRVRLKPLDAAAIGRYFRRVDLLDKAGAYAIQDRGAGIVAEVKGSLSNAVGLPMERVILTLHTF